MAKKRTGLDALREYEARSGRQTQSENQQTGKAGSSGGTWRSGLDALREYEASGGGQNVKNGPYNPDYRTNTRKATPQSYEEAYQQYKQYVAEYQKQTEFPRRVSVGTAAQQAGGSQKRDYSRMLGLNQLDGDMQPRVQAAQDIQKYLQFQRKVQTGTAAQQAATNAGQDYSRLIGLNQFDGELERRAEEWQRKRQAAQEAAALDQERGRRRTSEEYGKRIDALEAASDYARAQNAEGGGLPEFKDAYDKVNAGRETPMTLDEMQKELAYTRYKKAVLDKSVSGRVGEYAGDLATQFISGGADMALGGLGMVLGYLEQGANGAAAWVLRDLAKAVPDGSIKDKMLSLADDFSSYYTGESMTAGEETARYYRDELNRIGDEIEGKYKGVPLWIQQQMPSAGNMLFGAGLSGIAGVNNLVTLGLTSGGNSALEAKDKGASDAQALAYGVVAGGLEVFSERLFGGNPIYDADAGLINQAVGKLTSNKTIMKILNSKAFDIASEGLEEVVTEVLDPVAEWAIYNGDNTEFADAASIGNAFLGGVFLSAIGNVADAPKQLQQARYERVLRTTGSELADIAQSVDSADVQEAAQVIRDKIAYGVTPDAADIGAVLDAMDQAGETVDVEQVREAVDAEENEAKAAQAEAAFQTYNQYADERDARQEAREAPQQASVQAVQEAERQQQTPAQTAQAVQEVQNVQTQTGKRTQADAGRRVETREIDFNKEPQLTKYEQAQARKDRVFSLEPERRDEIFGSWSDADKQFAKRTKQIERDYTDRYGLDSRTAVDIAYMMNWLNSRFTNSYLSTLTVENEEEARILKQETREIFTAAQAKANTELSGYTRDATLEAIQAALELIPGSTETQQMQQMQEPSRAEQQQITQEAEAPKPAPAQAESQAVQETEEQAQEPALSGTKQAEQTAAQEEAPVQETNKKGAVRLEEQQENVVPDGGSRRESGRRAGKPFGAVAGRTEKTNAAAQQSRTAVERQNRARDLRLPKVSTVELGVSRGTGYRGNTVFMRENWDAGMKETAARVKQRTGLETTYVLGPLQVRKSNGGTARAAAVFTGDRIIVQADNLRATIDQLAAHETYHWIADNTPGLNAQIEQNIRDTFSEEEFDQIVETYIRSRRGVNDVPAEGTDAEFDEALNAIKEEIYADAYAGINAFGAHAEQYQQTVREAAEPSTTAQTAEKTGETRGPPEKYSYAGELARTADSKSLTRAEQMEESGASAENIFRETGWFKGADGQWRFEIDDSNMEFRRDGDARLMEEAPYRRMQELSDKWAASFEKGGEELTEAESTELEALQDQYVDRVWEEKYELQDFLKHDELYKAYPKLRHMSLIFRPMSIEDYGYYSPKDGTIVMNSDLIGAPEKTLIHEIQHIIQSMEGFARGASPKYWNDRMEDGFSKKNAAGEEMLPNELYRNTAGEIEARDVAERRGLSAEERRNRMPDTGNADTVFAEGDGYFSMSVKTAADGAPYVLVENQMTKAQLSNYQTVADYIAEHIGEAYTILESGQKVYIGKDLPNEYTQSQYTKRILQTSKLTAKNKAVSNLGEMIEIASNRRWEKTRHAENKDAPYGMYRYDTTFAFPVQGGARYKAFDAELVIRNASDGKKYLYDIVSIKENTGLALDLNDKARGRRDYDATRSDVSMDSIRRTEQKSQEKFSVTEATDGQEDRSRSERVNLPTIAQREMKSTLFKMFSVSKTQRTDVGRVIDYFADRIYTNGELTQTDRDVFLARLYSSGAMMESLRQQPDAVPDIVGDGRLYVSERARREFGSEWNDFRKRAFEAGIYLTDSTADRSAEAWTQALSEAAPDTFSETGGSQRQKLEQIVQAAEEAQDQNLSLSEYAQALAGKDFVSDDAILENMERQLDWAMRTFAEKAKLEVKLRGDKTAAIEAERDRSAQRNAQRSQNNAGVIEAMEARTDERLQKKDAATARSRQKLIEAMEARTDERLQKKDAALAKSKEKLIDAMEARIDERIQREKAREANRRALERQDRKDMAARQKARREIQELQKKTLKTLQWLNKNRFRAPEELREQFDEVLSDIDLYAVGTANEMQWSGKYNATWRDLAQMYQDAKANDPNFLPSKELERIVTRLDARKIGDMDLDALGNLYQAAVELRTEFANRNRVLGDAEERIFEDVYADSVREINSAAGGYTGRLSDRFMNMEQLSTMNVLERMAGWNPNSTWYGMAKQLEKGERDAQSYQVAAAQILQDFMQKNREWVMRSDGQGKDAIWYEIKVPELLELGMGDKPIFGKTVTVYMTPAQKVHMYLESRNYDNLRHMAGGRTFANRELYSKGKRQEAFAQGTTIKLAPETVKAIVSDLTVEEKALADVLDRYYNGYAKSEINRVSNTLYGYDKAMGKNYAPIFTNSSFTKSEPGIYDATAEGVGNLKTRQVSKNPTYNIGAYDAFERNVSQTSRFVGMAIPARNWKTLLNWRGSTTSMKTVIDGKWGEVTEKYIMDQLTKLEAGGSSEQDFVTTAADKIFSNYIAATFGFNPSIVLKQAGSIPLAAAYLGAENTPSPKQIAQIDRTLISKYTKMLDYRLMGYATPETKQLKDHPTKLQNNKVLNFTFGGGAITAMDGWAASTLWPWAENAVRRENPELEIGTQEQIDAGQSPFYQKVAERFNDAVARSQSTSDEMHQGRLRKSKNALAKALTMFRSDSAQVYNTVRQAIGEAQYYKRSGASAEVQRRANRRAGQAFVSAAGGYIWSTAVTFLMALLKHRDKKYRDDDGSLTALSVLKGMGEDLLSSIAGAASIGGEEVVELIGGTLSGERFYDIFNSQSAEQLNKVLELIDTHGKNINKFVMDGADLIKNKGDLTLYLKRNGNDMLGDIRNLAKEIATYGFSLPANNLETYILGTVKTVSPALGTAYDDAMQTANRNLLKGLTGDALRMRVQHVFQVRDVDVSSEAVQAVARLYEAGYTNAAPADTPSSLNIHDEKRELKAYQKQTYDMVWSEAVRNSLNELVQSDAFQSAGDDQQAKMLAKLYDYAAEQAKGVLFDDYEADAYVEKFKKLADNGVPESESIAFSVMAANVEGEKDADGKTISGSKRDEAMGILDGMELTGSQKSALLAANYSTTGFEPWSGYREALKAGGDTWDAFYQNAVSAKVADGKTQEDAEKAVKSALKSQLKEDYLEGSMPESEVSDYLQKYCGAEDEHDVYWTLEEWKGGEDWKKYGQFLDAVDKGVLADTRKVAKEYMKHGVEKGDLSRQLTGHFKEQWLAATGDEATRLKNAYISAYKAIGGDADKARDNIIKWRQEANKKKGDKK